MKILVEEELLAMLQSTLEANRLVMQKLEQKETGDQPLSLAEASQYLSVSRPTLQAIFWLGKSRRRNMVVGYGLFAGN